MMCSGGELNKLTTRTFLVVAIGLTPERYRMSAHEQTRRGDGQRAGLDQPLALVRKKP
jgi:hypothetical protein